MYLEYYNKLNIVIEKVNGSWLPFVFSQVTAHILKRNSVWGYKSLHGHVWCRNGDLELGGGGDWQRKKEWSYCEKKEQHEKDKCSTGWRKWCKLWATLVKTCCRWLTMNRRSSKPLSRNLLSYCGSPTCSSHSPTGWSRALPQAPSAERGKRFSREKPFSR